jgi:hypothetical protein
MARVDPRRLRAAGLTLGVLAVLMMVIAAAVITLLN